MLVLAIQQPLSLLLGGAPLGGRTRFAARIEVKAEVDEAFGASHTSFYTDAKKQDSYPMLDEILATKMANKELVSVVKTMFDACGTITEALREELVTVADQQNSAFG